MSRQAHDRDCADCPHQHRWRFTQPHNQPQTEERRARLTRGRLELWEKPIQASEIGSKFICRGLLLSVYVWAKSRRPRDGRTAAGAHSQPDMGLMTMFGLLAANAAWGCHLLFFLYFASGKQGFGGWARPMLWTSFLQTMRTLQFPRLTLPCRHRLHRRPLRSGTAVPLLCQMLLELSAVLLRPRLLPHLCPDTDSLRIGAAADFAATILMTGLATLSVGAAEVYLTKTSATAFSV